MGELGAATLWRKRPSPRRALDRWARHILTRVRARTDIDNLVALGLELGPDVFIADTVYIDPDVRGSSRSGNDR